MINIMKRRNLVADEVLQALARFDSATVYEAMGRRGALFSAMKPLDRAMKICGRAITVKTQPGDNLMIHQAIAMAGSNDVIVVDGGGFAEVGYIGDLMAAQALYNRVAGLVIDGGVRDAEKIIELGCPVFSVGICIKGVTKNFPGTVNHPICCAGAPINPGDVVIGDADGVVAVPHELAAEAVEKSAARHAMEEDVIRRIRNGEPMLEIMRFDAVLRQWGCTEEGER